MIPSAQQQLICTQAIRFYFYLLPEMSFFSFSPVVKNILLAVTPFLYTFQ